VLQQYKYACAARPGGPAIDLMGPWWQTSGWELYWWDMNVPVTYWATYAARRFDIAGTLSWWLEAHLATMPANIVVPPGTPNITDGMGFGSITSFDMVAPMPIEAGQQLGNPTWIAHNLLQHAAFTANTTMLRQLVFPFLRGTVNTYLAFAVNGSDGLIHLPPTASPEYPYPHGPGNDTNYDMSLFKWGAQTLLRITAQLAIEDPLIPRWNDVLVRLAPFPTNEYGYMVDSVNGFDIGHRHFSHLFSIFPLHLTTWDDADGGTPQTRDLITRSLDRWTGLTCTGGPGRDLCPNGFTFDGATSMSALIPGRAPAAAGNVTGFIVSGEMHASTLYSEGRQPCFESPPGAANALQEMLLQSWGGRVRVFPGVPATWPDTVIHRMGAEGGLAVSAVRTNGTLQWVGIEAIDYTGDAGRGLDGAFRSVVVLADGLGPASEVATDPAGIAVADAPGGAVALNIAVGQTVVLYPVGKSGDFEVTQLPGNSSQFNYWGKH
jgi:alpha-L-fucosidase 2